MSTLYDALKKAEDKLKETPLTQTSQPQINPPNFKVILIMVLLVLFILAVGRAVMISRASKAVAKKETPSGFFAKTTAPATQGTPQPIREPGEAYLEGIIYNAESSIAIINGKLVKEGEQADDFKVTKITQDTVEVQNVKTGASKSLSLP